MTGRDLHSTAGLSRNPVAHLVRVSGIVFFRFPGRTALRLIFRDNRFDGQVNGTRDAEQRPRRRDAW